MTNLKPCPFCGQQPAILKSNSWWTVDCGDHPHPETCYATATVADVDKESAIARWNTRAPDKAMQAAFEQVCLTLEGILPQGGMHYGDVRRALNAAAPYRKIGDKT